MVSYALRVAGPLKAYANTSGNASLQDKAAVTETTFTKARDDTRDNIAQGIHDEANAALAELADYGVAAAILSAPRPDRLPPLRHRRAENAPRRTQHAHRPVETRISARRPHRKIQLDGLVRQFEESNPELTMADENARTITDAGSQPEPPSRHRPATDLLLAVTMQLRTRRGSAFGGQGGAVCNRPGRLQIALP
ncbi:hypothetical protein BH20VER3_BH20VER3_05520 [soil metagenome]